jgi:hypothetical protein
VCLHVNISRSSSETCNRDTRKHGLTSCHEEVGIYMTQVAAPFAPIIVVIKYPSGIGLRLQHSQSSTVTYRELYIRLFHG